MPKKIPGVNFQAPVSTDDLTFEHDTVSEELQTRTRLLINGEYGIVDNEDPREASITDLDRPLNVLPSTSDIQVDISPGTAVTANGNWVSLDNKIFLLDLASSAIGAVNVVFIEYYLEEGEDRRVNKFQVDVAVRNQRPASNEDVIRVTTLANWQNSSIFPPDRKNDIVVLGVVTVNQLADLSLDITIDLGDGNFSFNRPWYSPVDIRHRQMVGTATPTSTNPHGTSLNDLASGRLTLYQQVLAHGMVMSKDVGVAKMPGIKVTETIQAASFLVDSTGDITRKSALYGGVGAKYANLGHFVVRLGSVYETDFPANQIAADYVPGESILVVPADEEIENDVTIEYLVAFAGEAPVDPPTNDLVFEQPADSELIVADGIAVSEIPAPIISFDGSGPIPRDFRVYLDADGVLVKSPQLLLNPTKLDALSGSTAINVAMQGDAPVEVGLTRAANVSGMNISLLLTGTGTDDQPLTETVVFEFGIYQDSTIPATEENPNQFARTENTFRTLDFIEILSRANDGNDSTIIVYGAQEAHITPTFTEKCALANIFWDGLAVDEVRDARPIHLDLHLPKRSVSPAQLDDSPWMFEDFGAPRFRDSFEGIADPRAATGTILIPTNANIVDGDTVDLGSGKILTARTPVAASGSLAALPFGISVLNTQTLDLDDGGGTVSVFIPTADYSPSDLAATLTSALNASALSETYTVTALTNRSFSISATGVFDILGTGTLHTVIGLSVGSGQPNYLGTGVIGLADGDQFTLDDGVTEFTFEFDTGGGVSGSNIPVSVNANDLENAVATAMRAAINGASFNIAATGAGSTVLLDNGTPGAEGNQAILESISTGFTLNPSGMSGGTDGGADSSLGEFNVGVGTDANTTAANIVATLANVTFASGITGVVGTFSGIVGVSLTKNAAGLLNNAIVVSSSGITAEGFERGSNIYTGISPDSFAEGLRTKIPTINKDKVRRKYRSRAVAVPSDFGSVTSIGVILYNPEDVTSESVRIRYTLESDPSNWQEYESLTLSSENPSFVRFDKTFSAAIHKIQFEMFGTFTHFLLLDETP